MHEHQEVGVTGASEGLPTIVSLVPQMVENPPVMCEMQVQSLGREDLWRREWLPTQYSWLENSIHREVRQAIVQGWGVQRDGHNFHFSA